MLHSVSVENYRSFAGKATVTLRPLTILLGRNSAGKSSLTRLFPLLRQSMERGTSAPILWNSSSVDFGRITDVINRQHPKLPMQLSFELCNEQLGTLGRRPRVRARSSPTDPYLTADVRFTAFLRAGIDGKTHYDRIEIRIDDYDVIELSFRNVTADISINGKKVDNKGYWSKVVSAPSRLFPYIFFEEQEGEGISEAPNTRDALISCLSKLIDLPDSEVDHSNALRNLRTTSFIDVHTSSVMPFVPRKNIEEALQGYGGFAGVNPENIIDVNNLADLLLLTYLSPIVEHIGATVNAAMENLSYLGPIRASGNRFYREQELSVDKIDDTGENLATYLGSLSAAELKSFNGILYESFGVEVRAHSEAGHLSIEIGRPGDENYDNLADVGFGFSQVLPLVAQIHSETRRHRLPSRARSNAIQISAVEQPELHLHPAYQASLADLFAGSIAAAQARGDMPIVILETHSEALVGRIGELISVGRLAPSDVAIHFVDKDEFTGNSKVRLAEYDDDGLIRDWPVGFFSAR